MPAPSTLTPSTVGLLLGASDTRREILRGLTVAQAWQHGSNLRSALRKRSDDDETPKVVWAWVNLELSKLAKELNANNTWTTADEIADATDLLIEEFPALKVEEVALVCKWLKAGKLLPKLYGSFKTRELIEAFRQYEGEHRAPVLEKSHKVVDPPRWKKRTSSNAGDKPFKPILGSKADLQALGIWPQESSSHAPSSSSPTSESNGTSTNTSE